MKNILNPKEASELFGVSPSALHDWEEKKWLIPFKTPGGHRRYDRVDLERIFRRSQDKILTNHHYIIHWDNYAKLPEYIKIVGIYDVGISSSFEINDGHSQVNIGLFKKSAIWQNPNLVASKYIVLHNDDDPIPEYYKNLGINSPVVRHSYSDDGSLIIATTDIWKASHCNIDTIVPEQIWGQEFDKINGEEKINYFTFERIKIE